MGHTSCRGPVISDGDGVGWLAVAGEQDEHSTAVVAEVGDAQSQPASKQCQGGSVGA